jgi:PAS domain S-box-containing protein
VTDLTDVAQRDRVIRSQTAEMASLFKTLPDLFLVQGSPRPVHACNQKVRARLFREKDLAAIEAGGPSVNEEEVVFASDGHQEALARSEDKFAQVFLKNPEAISIVSVTDETYVDVNPAFVAKTGLDLGSVLGHQASDLGFWLTNEDRVRYLEAFSTEGTLEGYETQLRRPSGQVLAFIVSSQRISVGQQECRLNCLIDITRRRKAEEDRSRLQEELQQARRLGSLGRLASGIAHDMNNVLAAILGAGGSRSRSETTGPGWAKKPGNGGYCQHLGRRNLGHHAFSRGRTAGGYREQGGRIQSCGPPRYPEGPRGRR